MSLPYAPQVLEMLSYLTYYGSGISDRLWALWPQIEAAVNEWAVDYWENILVGVCGPLWGTRAPGASRVSTQQVPLGSYTARFGTRAPFVCVLHDVTRNPVFWCSAGAAGQLHLSRHGALPHQHHPRLQGLAVQHGAEGAHRGLRWVVLVY